jgi:AcrR family transcriptional regulator
MRSSISEIATGRASVQRLYRLGPMAVELGDDTGGPQVGRRERKKLQTREALRAAALRLFTERGFDATTVEDITEAADVAPRTFFLHFASKEAVLLGDGTELSRALVAALEARPESECVFAAIRAAVLDVVAERAPDHDALVLRARLMEEAPSLMARNLEHYAEVARRLAQEIARRTGQDAERDLYPSLLASAVMNALGVAIRLWYRRGAREPLLELVAEGLDRIGSGLTATG